MKKIDPAMRIISLFIFLLIFSQSSYAQNQSFSFDPVGITFTIPESYSLLDTSSKTIIIREQIFRRITTFSFRSGSDFLTFIFSSGTEGTADWHHIYLREAERSILTMEKTKPSLKFRNHFSTVKIGGKNFNKVHLTGRDGTEIRYNRIKLSKHYKHHQISISYNFTNSSAMKLVEAELQNIRFK